MALSNWDSLSIDEKGNPTDGSFTSPSGVEVSIYKNWLYVRDKEAWRPKGPYDDRTVMSVQEGNFQYKDVMFRAIRGPKNGIYAVVYSETYQEQIKATKKNPHPAYVEPIRTAMIGIGCYGYEGHEWVGIQDEEKKFLSDWINKSTESELDMSYSTTDESGEWVRVEQPPQKYLDYEFDEWVRKIPLTRALRFNQGDAFFADKLGVKIPATEPGEAGPTILSQIVESMKKDEP